jgi:hypothetical protein
MKIDSQTRAYALGYFEGRAKGCTDIPRFENEAENLAYKLGYDAGVADYCQFELDQEAAA